MTGYHPFQAETRIPAEPAPEGSIDGQFHVFGPREAYPIRGEAAYEMPTATFEAARRMHKALGITRGVVVQSTTYGTDHSALLDALKAGDGAYKGCGVINDDVSDEYLQDLHDAGVRGARFNFLRVLKLTPTREAFDRTVRRVSELGWYIKMQPAAEGLVQDIDWFECLDVPVVIDHLGRAEFGSEPGPNLRKLLQLTKRDNFWFMLSNGHKLSAQGAPYPDAQAVYARLAEAAPDRVIWASDWPHPVSRSPVPNDADILELLNASLPDPALRRKVLIDNPASLFGFPPSVASKAVA